jgi:agmatine/peptidylarginine deiminase
MNIIEALKSGKPYRRAGDKDWYPTSAMFMFSSSMILADDWETQEKAVTITKTQLVDAIKRAAKRTLYGSDDIAKELGLE